MLRANGLFVTLSVLIIALLLRGVNHPTTSDTRESGCVTCGAYRHKPCPLTGRVAHREWGEGVVQRCEGDKMVVLFDGVGYKTLSVAFVTTNGLFERAGKN